MNLYKSILPVDEKGFYGEFGGSFVPPELQKNIDELPRPAPANTALLPLPCVLLWGLNALSIWESSTFSVKDRTWKE